jgi:hypothetical protein
MIQARNKELINSAPSRMNIRASPAAAMEINTRMVKDSDELFCILHSLNS